MKGEKLYLLTYFTLPTSPFQLLVVGLQTAGRERRETSQRAGRGQTFETVDQHLGLVELTDHDGRKLTVAEQRSGHLFLVGWRDQPVTSETFVERFQIEWANFVRRPGHEVSSRGGKRSRCRHAWYVSVRPHRASFLEPVV